MTTDTITRFFLFLLFNVFVCGAGTFIDTLCIKPEITDVSLSLDGKYVAGIYNNGKDQQHLFTYNIDSSKKMVLPLENDANDVYEYTWASNTRLVYNVSKNDGLYIHYFGSIDRDLNPIQKKLLVGESTGITIIDGLLNDSNNILIEKNYTSTYSIIGLKNIHNGRFKKEKRIRGTTIDYYTDFNGLLRFIQVYSRSSTNAAPDIYYRDNRESSWRKNKSKVGYSYYGFTSDGKRLFVTAHDTAASQKRWDTKCLFDYDFNWDSIKNVYYCDSIFDFYGDLMFFSNPCNPSEARLRGFSTWHDTLYTLWLDNSMQRIQHTIDSFIPQATNYIYDSDTALNRFLFDSYSDRKPEEYYIYDVKTNSVRLLFKSRPWIDPGKMAKTQVLTFTTRDSLLLHGYLTVPADAVKPYPTVVLLHGGPHFRDYWGFDPEIQILASKGYAVLQINYRGSTGYGHRISEKEKYDFQKMYLDVFDGTRYLIARGLADKNRIAIMGASFGGYLSLCGVTFQPELYRCAISEVGVFDWEKQIRSKLLSANNYVFDYYKPNVGNRKHLDSISPMHWVRNIKAPVFLAGGQEDRNVSSVQSYALYNKLRSAGVKVELFIKAGERHGFFNQKNITEYYKRVSGFLDRYMKENHNGNR